MRGRSWMLGGVAAGMLFAATAAWQQTGRGQTASPGAAQAQASEPADTFRLVWSEPLPALRSASLSSDGKNIVTVAANGAVGFWNWAARPNRALWTHRIPGVTWASVSVGANTVLADTPLDPTRPTLFWLGRAGKVLGRSTLAGAVWDTATSPDGTYAGVTTGSNSRAEAGYLYLYGLTPRPTQVRRERLAGIGDSVTVGRNAARLAVGTWDDSGVDCYTTRGESHWQYPPRARPSLADRLFTAQIAQAGNAVLGMSYANVRGADATLYYWDENDGRLGWEYPLGPDAFDPQSLISDNGRSVAVTYTRLVTHGEQSVAERRLIMLDAAGDLLWQKGGLLFSPTLVSVAADGHRVTAWDGHDTLYHLDDAGRITALYRFRASVRQTFGTTDGRWLLVYTQDGQLNLLRLDS